MKSVFYYDTPIGRLGLAENGRAVTDVLLHGERPADAEIRETPLLQKAAEQLAEYFGGLRTEFELPLEFEIGTPFERTVWQALSTIPYGETRSYADIARQIGRPAACRAVGRANGRNPLSIFPRVIHNFLSQPFFLFNTQRPLNLGFGTDCQFFPFHVDFKLSSP